MILPSNIVEGGPAHCQFVFSMLLNNTFVTLLTVLLGIQRFSSTRTYGNAATLLSSRMGPTAAAPHLVTGVGRLILPPHFPVNQPVAIPPSFKVLRFPVMER